MELRFEYKYAVPINMEKDLRKMISPFVTIDKYALGSVNNEYTVRSIYFDTPDFKFYHDKVDGLPYRKKVRLRGYNKANCSNPVFMETKNKYQVPLNKTRSKTSFENTLEMFQSGDLQQFVLGVTKNHSEANSFIYQILVKNLRPVILVIYEREPYTEKIDTTNRLRITLDKNLRSSIFPKINELYEEKGIKHSLPGFFILEVKFNQHFPVWMKSIIAAFQLKQQSLSKYVITIDEHQVVTKYNRYHVLEKKFI
jgi:hypothetical protein